MLRLLELSLGLNLVDESLWVLEFTSGKSENAGGTEGETGCLFSSPADLPWRGRKRLGVVQQEEVDGIPRCCHLNPFYLRHPFCSPTQTHCNYPSQDAAPVVLTVTRLGVRPYFSTDQKLFQRMKVLCFTYCQQCRARICRKERPGSCFDDWTQEAFEAALPGSFCKGRSYCSLIE